MGCLLPKADREVTGSMAKPHRIVVAAALTAVVLAACGGSDPGTGPVDPGATPSGDGERVPSMAVEAFDGTEVKLSDYTGTPLVVNFWASWCPPCVAEMPDLEAVHQATADQVTFVGVDTQDQPEAAARLVEETGVTYDLVRDPDGALFRAFGVFGMPSTFYVDATGTIVGRHTGLLTQDALFADLEENLGVERPTQP